MTSLSLHLLNQNLGIIFKLFLLSYSMLQIPLLALALCMG